MVTGKRLRVGDRLRRLIELIARLGTFLEDVDWQRVLPIIEKIIDAVDAIAGAETSQARAVALAALSDADERELKAAGFDFAAIVQLIMFVVELLRALRSGKES